MSLPAARTSRGCVLEGCRRQAVARQCHTTDSLLGILVDDYVRRRPPTNYVSPPGAVLGDMRPPPQFTSWNNICRPWDARPMN